MMGMACDARLSKLSEVRACDVDHHDVAPAEVQEDEAVTFAGDDREGVATIAGLGEEQRDRLRFARARRVPGR